MSKKEQNENKAIKILAKKDFTICHNEVFIKIKKGDDIETLKIPEKFMQNLETENVI